MIKLTKKQLIELARTYVLANTPFSLFRAYNTSPIVEMIRTNMSIENIVNYYELITVHHKRNEISLGLIYAVLTAILTHSNRPSIANDHLLKLAEFVDWGHIILDYANNSISTSQRIIIQSSVKPKINSSQTTVSQQQGLIIY